ncbi:endonuclease [Vibrio sp. D404a]|uniref:endonuclease I family protein n=1 Tax=unclassified Vibrio TaxID=2614977 RepID=UPI002553DB33|nr:MULTISPECIES: endonuclease [unclassified Vibrio]MDK9739912.1 endonuclease [Vibrio sp. D404a]MDK9799375.1 endonuclease [Vibrio sp. D449a]
MKKTLLTLLIPCAFSVNAAYEQAHDPHVVGTLPKVTCQTTIVEPPVPPGEVHNPDGYYDSALNKTGDELKAALNAIISTGITKLPYTDNSSPDAMDVWKALGITDEDPNNSANVILMYTGRSQEKSQRSGQGNLGQDNWNREHTYPKSNGGFPNEGPYAYTDIHHLRPTDESVNSKRSSHEFDEGGTEIAEAPGNYVSSNSFEPRDAVKGDVARMMFYMATRYEGNDPDTPDLELVPTVANNGTALGNVCALLKWNEQDPVDSFEFNRNSKIQKIQGNRNPFVDNPHWVDTIFAKDCN